MSLVADYHPVRDELTDDAKTSNDECLDLIVPLATLEDLLLAMVFFFDYYGSLGLSKEPYNMKPRQEVLKHVIKRLYSTALRRFGRDGIMQFIQQHPTFTRKIWWNVPSSKWIDLIHQAESLLDGAPQLVQSSRSPLSQVNTGNDSYLIPEGIRDNIYRHLSNFSLQDRMQFLDRGFHKYCENDECAEYAPRRKTYCEKCESAFRPE